MFDDLFDEAEEVVNEYSEWQQFGADGSALEKLFEKTEIIFEKLAGLEIESEDDRRWQYVYCTHLMHQSDHIIKYLAEIEMSE